MLSFKISKIELCRFWESIILLLSKQKFIYKWKTMIGNAICNNNAKSKYKNSEVPNRAWNQFQLLTIPIGSTKMWQYMCEAALGGMAPLKCIFISCIADFGYSVVTCLGPDSHPPGPGDQFNNSLQGEDLWGLCRWGWRSPAAANKLGGCVCDCLTPLIPTAHRQDIWAQHIWLPQTLLLKPLLLGWQLEGNACLGGHVGAEGSLQPGLWLKDQISSAFSVQKASWTFQNEGMVNLLLNLHTILSDRT